MAIQDSTVSPSVASHLRDFSGSLHALSFESLLLAVENGRGLLEELPFLPLPDDPLFFDLALEALDCLLEGFIVADFDIGYVTHLPSILEFQFRPIAQFCQE